MLFLVLKPQNDLPAKIKLLAGDEAKDVLLASDGVFLGSAGVVEKLKKAGVENIYVSKECLSGRSVRLAADCRVMDYNGMIPLMMEDHTRIVTL